MMLYTVNDRRLGRIRLLAATINDQLDAVRSAFGFLEFVPISVYHLFLSGPEDTIEFTGNSPKFRELERDAAIPLYDIRMEPSTFQVWNKESECWDDHNTHLFIITEIE